MIVSVSAEVRKKLCHPILSYCFRFELFWLKE